MNCYKHQENTAVSLCRICYRGMCNACVPAQAIDITCSPICAQLVERQYAQTINWIHIYLGLVFLGFGIWDYIVDRDSWVPYFLIIFGLIYIVAEILQRAKINRARKSLRYPDGL